MRSFTETAGSIRNSETRCTPSYFVSIENSSKFKLLPSRLREAAKKFFFVARVGHYDGGGGGVKGVPLRKKILHNDISDIKIVN